MTKFDALYRRGSARRRFSFDQRYKVRSQLELLERHGYRIGASRVLNFGCRFSDLLLFSPPASYLGLDEVLDCGRYIEALGRPSTASCPPHSSRGWTRSSTWCSRPT